MSACHVTLSAVFSPSGGQGVILYPIPAFAETLDGSSADTSAFVVPAGATNLVWCIVTDEAVWAKFGAVVAGEDPEPLAAAGEDHMIPAGIPFYFGAVGGHAVCVLDVA